MCSYNLFRLDIHEKKTGSGVLKAPSTKCKKMFYSLDSESINQPT